MTLEAALQQSPAGGPFPVAGLQARLYDTPAGPVEAAVVGSGPALLVIHGTGGSWRQSIQLAEDFASTHTVILVSRPGYGLTPVATGPNLAAHARAYAGLIEGLGVGPAIVLGISGGGPGACAFAALQPDACRGLILVCPAVHHLVKMSPMLRLAALPFVIGAYTASNLRRARLAAADPQVAAHYYDAQLTPIELAAIAADPARGASLTDFLARTIAAPAGLAGLGQDVQAARQKWRLPDEVVGGIRVPTLILQGDADVVVPFAHAEYYAAAIPGAQLETFPGSGHFFLLALRPESNALIARFLDGLPTD